MHPITSFCPPAPNKASSRALAAPVLVRSHVGTLTRVHSEANHFAWLHISLFLTEIAERAAARRGPACGEVGGGAQPLPVGNHGETFPESAS